MFCASIAQYTPASQNVRHMDIYHSLFLISIPKHADEFDSIILLTASPFF